MNTKTIQVKKTKIIDDGTENVPVYVTVDGKEFRDKKEATRHENAVISEQKFKEKYKLRGIRLDEYYSVIFIKKLTEEVKSELYMKFCSLNTYKLSEGYNFIYTDNSGDYASTECYSLEEMIKTREEELRSIRDICQD